MMFFGSFFKGVAALAALAAGIGLFSLAAGPTASFTMTPAGNPVVGQVVQLSDTSSGSPTSWVWNFGDGQSSTQQSPTHVYGGPGPFNMTLTASNAAGSTQQTQSLIVSTNDTLRLNNKGNHAFLVTLVGTNQHNGNVQGPGQAIPQNDLFGYFSLPTLTNDPNNPEVFVKILDGTTINGQFWVFYGHLTDLIYDITVTEVATGFVKTYHKDAGNSAGGFDTSGFSATATPTITPTPGSPTATPTPTPTAGALITVNLVARDFHWDFDNSGQPTKTLRVGQPYQLHISRASGAASHQFTGLPEFSCSASSLASPEVCNFTPSGGDIGQHPFACDNTECGTKSQHDDMQNGVITVVQN